MDECVKKRHGLQYPWDVVQLVSWTGYIVLSVWSVYTLLKWNSSITSLALLLAKTAATISSSILAVQAALSDPTDEEYYKNSTELS